jgi:hypothetical protein
LSGTPTATQAATAYTITATNATGSTTRTFTLTVTSVVYTVGQTGPGGGTIFYVALSPFSCGPTLNLICNYLEAAPTSGVNSWADARYAWSGVTNSAIGTTTSFIGSGYQNTLAMINQSNTASRAGTISQAYRGPNNLTDWYLPSAIELQQMCKWQYGNPWTSDGTMCTGGTLNSGPGASGFVAYLYWSSSEYNYLFVPSYATYYYFPNGGTSGDEKSFAYYVRPIRAF